MPVTLEPIENFRQITIDRSPPPALDRDAQERVARAWESLCAENPRYFDGPMLVFDSMDHETGIARASVRAYKHHAVRDAIDLGLSLLAVTAAVFVQDRVLIGQRSAQTHRYGGLWELGPSGGIDVPGSGDLIDRQSLLDEAIREIEEEAGFLPDVIGFEIVGLVHDHAVGSTDIVVVLDIEQPEAVDLNWEYDDTRWLTLEQLVAMCQEKPDEFIPTSVALSKLLLQTRR